MTERARELAASLSAVRARIDSAMERAGRSDQVTLIAVTKFFPASDVDLLAGLGVRDIGENRDQEARDKLPRVSARADLTVHFIGQLQSNKAGSVARYADVVHGIDRPKLVGALDRAAGVAGRRIGALVQVGLDRSGTRGGAVPDDVAALADAVAASEHLDLRGLMAVAPLDGPPRPAFATLRTLSERLREDHPSAVWISAGMSGDLEDAIAEGATHLRVGSAILGSRPSHR